jgi:peptidyl-tRNA hydrolase
MIRLTKHNGKEYIVVNTDIQVGKTKVPMQVQINVVGVSEEDKTKLYQFTSLVFNRSFKKIESQKTTPPKPWYKFW